MSTLKHALVILALAAPTVAAAGDAGLAAHHAFTNAQGRTVVRYDQTWQGHRVWGGGAILHVESDGRTRILDSRP